MELNRVYRFILLVFFMVPFIVSFKGGSESESENMKNSKPNIIFILTDDLGFGDVGYYGQEKIKTPHLDSMATQSMVFSNAYAGGPVCAPSRGVLMTGLHQGRSPIRNNPPSRMAEVTYGKNDIIIAEKLKEAGYSTACFGKWGGPQGSEGYPTLKGFDEFIGYDTHIWAHDYYTDSLRSNEGLVYPKKDYPQFLENGKVYTHEIFVDEALNFIENQNTPFFLYLSITIPHSPYNPPDSYIEPYRKESWPKKYKNYAGMITRMDKDVGRVLRKLEELGISDNTIVIFTSDNGPQSGYRQGPNDMTRFFNSNGRYRGIKRDILEGGVHIPFWVKWDGQISHQETEHPIGFFDVMPTLCDLAGVKPPEDIDGISFIPTLSGNSDEQEKHDYFYWEYIICWAGVEHEASRQGILDLNNWVKGIKYGKNGDVQLFDLKEDTLEMNDVSSDNPEVSRFLNGKMKEMREPSDIWPLPEKPFFPPKGYNSNYEGENRWTYK